jgi:hypothetical protein
MLLLLLLLLLLLPLVPPSPACEDPARTRKLLLLN